ncbi:nucleotidyltransferase family protein [Flavobacteriales bacterium]|nr:nucleotidyltransferase family protein [Flavobacteriales bacterium]
MTNKYSNKVFTLGSILNLAKLDKNSLEEKLNDISDWKPVLKKALDTHLAPILHKTFSGLRVQIPTDIKDGLQNSYNQVLVRNIVLQKQFVGFAKALNEHQIPLVPLKGIYLSEVIYKDLGLRHLSDIDVLIKEESLDRVCGIMSDDGWQVKSALLHDSLHEERFSHAHPITLVKNEIQIELHTHLYNGNQFTNLTREKLWEVVHSEEFLGVEIHQFSNELLLQHQCLHLHKHLFGYELKMLSFCDIREILISKQDIFDWVRFEKINVDFGYTEEISRVLYLSHKFWNVDVPVSFRNPVMPTSELDERFRTFMNGVSRNEDVILKNKLGIKLNRLEHLHSNEDKLKYVAELVFPSRAFMRKHYQLDENTWLFPWYIYRPVELTLKVFRTVLAKR